MAHEQEATTWYKRYYRPVCKWLRAKSISPAEVEDIAQEVFIRLLRYDSKQLVENPGGYIFKIAANTANEWHDRARNRHTHDPELLEELVIEDPFAKFDQESLNQYVTDLMDQLPPRRREYLWLHAIAGMTYKQIAEKKGTTYRIVLRELTKAYTKLRVIASPEILT